VSDEALPGCRDVTGRGASAARVRRTAFEVAALQLWAFLAIVVTGPVPYLIPALRLAGLHGVAGVLLAIPAGIFVLPGFWLVYSGWIMPAVFAAIGAAALPATLRRGSTAARAWIVTGTVLSLATLAFALTPLGRDVRSWVLD
jgi:hypothetical protein